MEPLKRVTIDIKDPIEIKIPQDSGNKPVQVAKGIWVIPKQAASDAEVIGRWYGRV